MLEAFIEFFKQLADDYPRWNFHKYLFNRNGGLVGSFPSQTRPLDTDLVNTIESLL